MKPACGPVSAAVDRKRCRGGAPNWRCGPDAGGYGEPTPEWRWQRALRLLLSVRGAQTREVASGDGGGVRTRFDGSASREADDLTAGGTAADVRTATTMATRDRAD